MTCISIDRGDSDGTHESIGVIGIGGELPRVIYEGDATRAIGEVREAAIAYRACSLDTFFGQEKRLLFLGSSIPRYIGDAVCLERNRRKEREYRDRDDRLDEHECADSSHGDMLAVPPAFTLTELETRPFANVVVPVVLGTPVNFANTISVGPETVSDWSIPKMRSREAVRAAYEVPLKTMMLVDATRTL